jgi:hypothetical protein
LSALNNQVLELKTLLQKSDIEKEALRNQLKDAFEENQRRLESLSSNHESRITEMHCVIVELKKKLNAKHENAIIEENEAEGSGKSSSRLTNISYCRSQIVTVCTRYIFRNVRQIISCLSSMKKSFIDF